MLGQPGFSPFGPNTNLAYRHVGLTNNFTWADPEHELVVALLTNDQPLIGSHIAKLGRWRKAFSRIFPTTMQATQPPERVSA